MDDVTWWTAFGAIAQAIGALATFLAVAVSLWIVRSERQLSAKATAGIRMLFAGDGSPGVYLVAVTILNTGLRPIRVTSTGWRTGWAPWGPKVFRHRHAVQNTSMMNLGKRPPFVIEPGMEETVFTTVEDMKAGSAANPDARLDMFDRQIGLLGDASICAVVSITGRKPVLARVEPSLAAFLKSNEHPSTTADEMADAAAD